MANPEPAPLTITDRAFDAIREVIASQKVSEDYGLRVGMRGGGCGGMAYLLGFDQKKDSDLEYELNGLSIFIDRSHSMYVLGMEIDWHEDEDQRGFVFNNPREKVAQDA